MGRNKSDAWKLLGWVGAVAVFFAFVNVVAYFGARYDMRHSGFRVSRIARGDLNVDVLVVGNSRAVNLATGRMKPAPSIFNLAYNGLNRPATLALVRSYFERGNRAKYVVIETTALFAGNTGNCDLKSYWPLYPELDAVGRRFCASDERAAGFFPLTLFDSELFIRASYYFLLKPRGDQDWANDYAIPPHLCGHVPLAHLELIRRTAQHLDKPTLRADIAGLRSWLDQHGYHTRIVLLLAPVLPEPDALPAIRDLERVDDQTFGTGGTVDMATALPADCGYFADVVHVNRAGRAKALGQLERALGLQ